MRTTYDYDPLTFRLTQLKTTRAGPDATAAQLFTNSDVVQDLRYTYDPVGNITRIDDAAPRPSSTATSGSIPRPLHLRRALPAHRGARPRAHRPGGVRRSRPADANYRDYPFAGHRDPNDLQALRNYTERYEYDAAGNFQARPPRRDRRRLDAALRVRRASQLEPARKSNRLTSTTVGNGLNRAETYAYDAHGNMIAMPHLPSLAWDYDDRLRET